MKTGGSEYSAAVAKCTASGSKLEVTMAKDEAAPSWYVQIVNAGKNTYTTLDVTATLVTWAQSI